MDKFESEAIEAITPEFDYFCRSFSLFFSFPNITWLFFIQVHKKGRKEKKNFFFKLIRRKNKLQLLPDEPFHNFDAWKSVARRSWIT